MLVYVASVTAAEVFVFGYMQGQGHKISPNYMALTSGPMALSSKVQALGSRRSRPSPWPWQLHRQFFGITFKL